MKYKINQTLGKVGKPKIILIIIIITKNNNNKIHNNKNIDTENDKQN